MGFDFNPSPELMQKANMAKTPEELLALAKENGMDITPEQAREYFARLHKTGELEDDELENVAGGGCYKGDKLVVTPEYTCNHWTCKYCGQEIVIIHYGNGGCPTHKCSNGKVAGGPFACKNCKCMHYKSALMLCYHPAKRKQ